MTNKNDLELFDFDDLGTFTEPWNEDDPVYRFRELAEYAEKVGKKIADLTDEEREQFRSN